MNQTLIFVLDLAGVAVFALSGAMAAAGRRLDLFGVVVIACAAALGGGTLRDIVLDAPHVFWIERPIYIYVSTVTALAFALLRGRIVPPQRSLLTADALGLALFTVLGAQRALSLGTGATAAVLMAVTTGVAGGMIRDLLTGRTPLVLRSELYATASLAGAIVYVCLRPLSAPTAALAAATITFALRMAAIRWDWSLPVISVKGEDDDGTRA